jgi:hypothetical protein
MVPPCQIGRAARAVALPATGIVSAFGGLRQRKRLTQVRLFRVDYRGVTILDLKGLRRYEG